MGGDGARGGAEPGRGAGAAGARPRLSDPLESQGGGGVPIGLTAFDLGSAATGGDPQFSEQRRAAQGLLARLTDRARRGGGGGGL